MEDSCPGCGDNSEGSGAEACPAHMPLIQHLFRFRGASHQPPVFHIHTGEPEQAGPPGPPLHGTQPSWRIFLTSTFSGWVPVSRPDSDLLSHPLSPPAPPEVRETVQSSPTSRRPSPARVPSTRAHGADFSLSSREDPFLLPTLRGPGQAPQL